MVVPFIEMVKTLMGVVRQELEIKNLALSMLNKVEFCKTLKMRYPLGSWIWVLNSEENSG